MQSGISSKWTHLCRYLAILNFKHSKSEKEQTFYTRFLSCSFLSLQILTNALRDPIHVMEMRIVPILMVRSNVNVILGFQGMARHAEVSIQRLLIAKFIFMHSKVKIKKRHFKLDFFLVRFYHCRY